MDVPVPDVDPGAASQRFSLILGGVRRGLSNYAIIKAIRSAGLGLRDAVLGRLIRDARAYYANVPKVTALEPTQVPAPHIPTPWASKTMAGYGYSFRYQARRAITGEVEDRYYTVVTDSLITPQEAFQQLINANADQLQRYEKSIVGAVLVNIVNYIPVTV
jgi:hypothetical protein